MKKIIYLIISVVILGSCATSNNVVSSNMLSKKKYRKGWHYINNGKIRKSSTLEETEEYANSDHKSPNVNKSTKPNSDIALANSIVYASNDEHSITASYTEQISDIEIIKSHIPKLGLNNEGDCAEIIKRDGDIILGKIIEVGITEIKYKKCDNLEGPTYSILKSEVFMMKYANGSKDVFKEETNQNNSANNAQPYSGGASLDYMGLTGIFTAFLALIVFLFASSLVGALLGLIPLILGAESLSMEKKNPGRWTTKKSLGRASLILGILLMTAGLFFGIFLLFIL
jgi:hypothetical protein